MGNFLDVLAPKPVENPETEKAKIRNHIIRDTPEAGACPSDAFDPAVEFMYTVTKTRIVAKGEKCPEGTSVYHDRGDLIECAGGGVNDPATTAKRDAAMAKLKDCVAKNQKRTTSTYVPEPYEKSVLSGSGFR